MSLSEVFARPNRAMHATVASSASSRDGSGAPGSCSASTPGSGMTSASAAGVTDAKVAPVLCIVAACPCASPGRKLPRPAVSGEAAPMTVAGEVPVDARHDWTRAEVLALLARPFHDLLADAQAVHRSRFRP